MKKAIFIFLAIFLQKIASAQTTTDSIRHFIKQKKVVIKFSPLCLADPNYPAIQLGVEVRLKNPLSYQQEIGYITHSIYMDSNTPIPIGQGIKVRSEIRKYISAYQNNSTMNGMYIAAEGFYTYTYFYREGDFKLDNGNICTDVYKINKHVIGMNFKFGYQKIFKSGITLDMYIGLGLKYRKINHLEKDCNGTIKYPVDYLFVGAEKEGEKLVPNLPLNIKIGYAF